jgi:hypothetical protein
MVMIRALRLSPTAEAKAFLPSETPLCMSENSSNRASKPGRQIAFEERGDAKLHRLSPRRQISAPQGDRGKEGTLGRGERSLGGDPTGRRFRGERRRGEGSSGGAAVHPHGRRQAGESRWRRRFAPVVPPETGGGEERRTRRGRESTNRAPRPPN